MTDPERLESGLGDLLRRTNWQGPAPAPTDPEPLGPEERARWQSLMDEPVQVQPVARRVPIGLVGATGLVAAVLVVAVGISSVRNSQQPQPVAESVAPPDPSTLVRPSSRAEPLPRLAPKTAATPPPVPRKVVPPLPASPPTKPVAPNRTTIVASAPQESEAPAAQPSPPAPAPEAPQKAKASRPTQPVPAAINDDGQANSTSVPDGEFRTDTDILDGVNITATRRLNRAADSTLAGASTNQARSERQEAAKRSVAGAPAPPNRLYEAARAPTRLELVASGLETTTAASLRAQLAMVTLPAGLNGEVVFEVVVEAGRVRELRLIEEDSNIKDPTVIDAIRSRLLAWTLPVATNLKSRIALRAQP